MTRRVETLEIFSVRQGMRSIALDVTSPEQHEPGRFDRTPDQNRCLIPAAYLSKDPVAAYLEVRDAGGNTLPVPTKAESMALTHAAVGEIARLAPAVLGAPAEDYRLDPDLMAIVGDVIRMPPRDARICRLKIEQDLDPGRAAAWLLPLLRRLEDHYLLWVPVCGPPGSSHHLTIQRSDVRKADPVLRPSRPRTVEFTVKSSIGDIPAAWRPPHRWRRRPDFSAAIGRVLLAFGLMPVKFQEETLDAQRFSSYHLRIVPPDGLILREVRAGHADEESWDELNPTIEALDSEVDQTVQGNDSRVGHIHLARESKPRRLFSRVTIGLRPGTTTLWALVAVLTCGLLWAYHRSIESLGEAGGEPFDIDLAVAVSVLLVGPTFASAWTLREKDRTLMRTMMAGTRLLLLASAVLSVGTALALAEIRPFSWEIGPAVHWYASAAYAVAVLIVVGWLQARSVTWIAYRRILTQTKWNMLVLIILALGCCAAILKLESQPILGVAFLILAGLAMTAIAGNRTSVVLGERSRLPAALAGLASVLTLALAARELRFFNLVADKGVAHEYGVYAELAVALAAAAILATRYSIRRRRRRSREQAMPASGRPRTIGSTA